MRKLTYLMLILGLWWIGCKPKDRTAAQDKDGTEINFGDLISEEGAESYESFLAKMAGPDSLKIKVIGKVAEVCQAKGCWMNLGSMTNDIAETAFVQFKDYAFFVPTDLTGKTVLVEGIAYREETSVEDLRHYAEDEGKTPEEIAQITEPVVELKIMASGVKILQ